MTTELDMIRVKAVVESALNEDTGNGDITTDRVIPVEAEAGAVIIAKQAGVICGLPVAETVFHSVDGRLVVEKKFSDGDIVEPGQEIMEITGWARAILCAERTALNFLGRLSGIATLTRRFADKIKDSGAVILDTRKTTPGLRFLEKYAVAAGGGENHRFGLFDRILIKDNHLAIQKKLGAGYIYRAVNAARKKPEDKVEIEAQTFQEVVDAVNAGADIVLLDNMDIPDICRAVELYRGKVLFEVSGGVSLDNIAQIASTGVDYISIGALTHSAPALDLSLEVR